MQLPALAFHLLPFEGLQEWTPNWTLAYLIWWLVWGTFARFMPAAEVLACATSGNAELLALSGQRSPYPGPLGVVAAGAQADLLVLDADPLTDIEIIGDPTRMKPYHYPYLPAPASSGAGHSSRVLLRCPFIFSKGTGDHGPSDSKP
ncbi:hypothetical protein CCR91_12365, partial [Thiorhodovibrio winogradskyi]|nr:hypothetical protein [Thiorhodovibrio winogradskyi]